MGWDGTGQAGMREESKRPEYLAWGAHLSSLVLKRWRPDQEFKVVLSYTMSSRPSWATWDPDSRGDILM